MQGQCLTVIETPPHCPLFLPYAHVPAVSGGGDKMCNYTCSFPKFTMNREGPHSWKSMMNENVLCRTVTI